MRSIYVIIALLIFLGCNNSQTEKDAPDSKIISDSSSEKLPVKDSQSLTTKIPLNVDDNFETFLKYFNEDSLFQVSRMDFPIKYKFADSEKDYEMSEATIKQYEFRKLDLTYDPASTLQRFDAYERNVKVEGNKATVEFRGIDNGIMVDYYFEKKKGKWKLTTWDDSST